jgi:hypothetical protein
MIFELLMLSCFGFALLIRILKTFRSKTARGLSPVIFFLILTGFISGIVYKLMVPFEMTFFIYIADAVLVSIQIFLFFYYRNKDLNNTPPYWV